MNLWKGALRAEGRKALGSPVPWITGLVVLSLPVVGAAFMLIVRDPEGAKALGLIGTKARLSGLTADWPSYLGFINQSMAAGFLFVLALFITWIFGREWSDRTVKLLLALPARRFRVVAAKFGWTAVWGAVVLALMGAETLVLGHALDLPLGTRPLIAQWAVSFATGGALTLVLGSGTALFASLGRGYLVPVAWTLATLVAAELGVALGWGTVVPWAIPSVVSAQGASTTEGGSLAIVLVTGALGVGLTTLFWTRADHPR